jgi:uncharacterized protein YdeI (YjbR/CyaY-like superfamily)
MEIDGSPLAFTDSPAWRAWLEEHHASADEAWVLIAKKHGIAPLVSLVEATEEAVCFGWIDSAMRPIDAEHYVLRFTPRRAASNWSPTNRARAVRLIEEGRMTDAGLAAIQEAKQSGRWDDPADTPPV